MKKPIELLVLVVFFLRPTLPVRPRAAFGRTAERRDHCGAFEGGPGSCLGRVWDGFSCGKTVLFFSMVPRYLFLVFSKFFFFFLGGGSM